MDHLKEKKSRDIRLEDCLEFFSQEEKLTGKDQWYCSKCKDHVDSLKKMEIYKLPDVLVIHLNRFSMQKQFFSSSRKLTDMIEFPTENLQMSKFVLDKEGKEQTYDLYAVSNHYGSMGGGHYTAFAKNPVYQKWFEFDDDYVKQVSEGAVNTKAAYVLFYKRRS